MLDPQFRMHPEIATFPKMRFYRRAIRNGITIGERRGPALKCFTNADVPILLLESGDEESINRGSYENWEEGEIVERLIRTLIDGGVRSDQSGVIKPYGPRSNSSRPGFDRTPKCTQGSKSQPSTASKAASATIL
jgi:regulator of nonsense transcripts 1